MSEMSVSRPVAPPDGPGHTLREQFAQAEERQRGDWERGEPQPVEVLLAAFPALQGQTERILDLIYHEILFRETQGQQPSLDEYQRRFPSLSLPLTDLFEVHRAVNASAFAAADSRADSTPPFAAPEGRRNVSAIPGYEILGEL